MDINEQQTIDNYEIEICEFEEVKDIDPVSKERLSDVGALAQMMDITNVEIK